MKPHRGISHKIEDAKRASRMARSPFSQEGLCTGRGSVFGGTGKAGYATTCYIARGQAKSDRITYVLTEV